MKKVIFLVLVFLSFYAVVTAETDKELFGKGVLLFKQGQYQKAIDEFSKLIALAPDNADAYKNRGVSYMKQEKFDLAIKDFETAKELFPELKGLYSNLGVAWYYKKDYEKAIENYDIEIKMAPENHVAYFNRALCLAELDRNQEALSDLSKTLALMPDFYWALCYKADLLAQQKGQELQAVETYEDAIRIDPKNTYAIDKLARLKQKIKEKQEILLPEAPEIKPRQAETRTDEPQTVTPPETEMDTVPIAGYALQEGAFHNPENARKLKKKLIDNGFDARLLILKDSRDKTWYLVRSGRYENQEDARKDMLSLKEKLDINAVIRSVGTW